MSRELRVRNLDSQKTAGQQYFRAAWSIYLESFDDNEEEFARVLVDGFRSNMAYLTLRELDQVAVALRKFEMNKAADQLINDYFALHGVELAKSKSRAELAYTPEDICLAQRLVETMASISDTRSLGEVVKQITDNSSWHLDDEEALAGAEVEEYYEFFRGERPPGLRSYVNRCLEFGRDTNPSERRTLIAAKAQSALRRLASESRINRLRVEALYGISLEERDHSEESARPKLEEQADGQTGVAEESDEVEGDSPSA